MSSHLSPEVREKYLRISDIQDQVESMNPSTFSQVLSNILDSPDFQAQPDSFSLLIVSAARIRPLLIDLLVNLAKELCEKSKAFQEYFLEDVFMKQHATIGLHYFLYKCYETGIVPLETIAQNLKYFLDRPFRADSYHIFIWFAPELEKNYPEYFNKVMKPSEEEVADMDDEYQYFWKNYEALKENDWELLKKKRNDGKNDSEFINIFLNDDVDALKGINCPDLNMTISPSCYDRTQIFSCNPTLLCCAAYLNAIKCCKYLIENGADVSKPDDKMRTPTIFAIAGGASDELISIFNEPPSVRTILVAASNHRNKFLFSQYSLENQGSLGGVLHQAAGTNNIRAAIFSFEHGIDVNNTNQADETPLHYAANYGYTDIVRLLLSCSDINVNALEQCRRPPIHLAIRSYSHHTANVIFSHPKLDPFIKDENGETLLHLVSIYDYFDIFEKLLKLPNIDINVLNETKRPPLHLALMSSSFDIVKVLLKMSNIDINYKDAMDRTALHIAVLLRNKEILNLVLSFPGIDVTIKEMHNMTPLDYAKRIDYQEGVDILTPLMPPAPNPDEEENKESAE